MRVAIFSPYATVTPHFENELELIQLHLDQGHQVEYLACLGELQNCDFNAERDPEVCRQCITRRHAGLELLDPKISVGQMAGHSDALLQSMPESIESIQQLVSWRIDNFDVGYAVLSSMISLLREPEPCLIENRPLMLRLIETGLQSYHATLDYLDRHHPDRVYIFNGRFVGMRAVLRACQNRKIDCFVHERGCDSWHYDLCENHLPHDIAEIDQVIKRHWAETADAPDREKIASQWYHDRRQGVERNWHSYTKSQIEGTRPQNWRTDRHNIAIFCSSEHEFNAIGPSWKMELYEGQNEGIRRIARDLQQADADAHVYVRLHPALKDTDNTYTREARRLAAPNMTVILPEESIDTYQLMIACDTVVTFGSSIGIEAIFWGKPSVLLGQSQYKYLGGTYLPKTHEEAIETIAKKLKPLDKSGAIMFGYWLQTRGIRFKYFEPNGLFAGQFKGQIIHTLGVRPRGIKRLKKNLRRLGRDALKALHLRAG